MANLAGRRSLAWGRLEGPATGYKSDLTFSWSDGVSAGSMELNLAQNQACRNRPTKKQQPSHLRLPGGLVEDHLLKLLEKRAPPLGFHVRREVLS